MMTAKKLTYDESWFVDWVLSNVDELLDSAKQLNAQGYVFEALQRWLLFTKPSENILQLIAELNHLKSLPTTNFNFYEKLLSKRLTMIQRICSLIEREYPENPCIAMPFIQFINNCYIRLAETKATDARKNTTMTLFVAPIKKYDVTLSYLDGKVEVTIPRFDLVIRITSADFMECIRSGLIGINVSQKLTEKQINQLSGMLQKRALIQINPIEVSHVP